MLISEGKTLVRLKIRGLNGKLKTEATSCVWERENEAHTLDEAYHKYHKNKEARVYKGRKLLRVFVSD